MAKVKRDRSEKSEKSQKAESDPEKQFSEELRTEGGESQEERLKKIEEFFKTEDGINLELSRLLWQVNANKDYESLGYDSFEDYVEQRLGFKRRKGKYLVAIWQKFRIELGLEPKKLGRIGWWKSSIISPVVTLDNHEEWINKARRMKSRELQKEVAKALGSGSSDELKSYTVKLSETQYANVDAAVKQGMREVGSDAKGNALDLICTEFQANRVKPEEKPGWIMKQLERNWDCRLLAMDADIFSEVKAFAEARAASIEEEKKVIKKEKLKEAVEGIAKSEEEAPTKKKKSKKSKLERLKKLAKKPEEGEEEDEEAPAEGPEEGVEKAEAKKKIKNKKHEADDSEQSSDEVSEDETEAEAPEEAGV